MRAFSQTRPKGNETEKLIRTKDWSATSLGPVNEWPQSLKTSVDLILPCDFPMVVLWGPELIQIYNNGYRTIMGDKHPAGLGQATKECWPEVWDFNKPIYNRVRAGETVTLEDQLFQINRHGSPEDAWFTLCYSPLPDETGAVAGVLVTVFETTDRIQADTTRQEATEALRKTKENFRLAVDVADLGIWEYNPDTDQVHISERMGTIWGVTNKTLPLREVVERVHPDDRAKVMRQINSIIEPDTGDDYSIEHRLVWEDGTVRWISANGQAQFTEKEDGRKAVQFFGTALDITEWKRAEQELQEMNKTLEQRVENRTEKLKKYQTELRSLVSQLNKAEEQERHRLAAELHDNLGQMLAIAKMNLSTLESAHLPDDAINEIADTKKLIDDAITFTRQLMTELRPPPALDKEDTGEILAWVAKKIENQYGLEVTIEDDGKPKPLSEDARTTLYQCVRELFFNVVKHAGINEARLILSRLDGQVKVTVEDEGRGIDPKAEEPIPTEEGGFGLFNIRERMSCLNGRLDIDSEPGRGTKATLYTPVEDEGKVEVKVEGEEETSLPSDEQT